MLPSIFATGRSGSRGYTFIELVIVTSIIAILASAVMPLATVSLQRQREIELRRSLREIRTAIDRFKDAADQGMIKADVLDPADEGYPADLVMLVEGVPAAAPAVAPPGAGAGVGAATGAAGPPARPSANDAAADRRLRFLRRIPLDPMTRSTEWGMRSYQDRPDDNQWGGQNVFDVYSLNDGVALDGTRYREW